MAYKQIITLASLQDDKYTFVQNDTELAENLDMLGFPVKYRKDITGMVLLVGDGDILAAWVTESSRPYDLWARYCPLPVYRPMSWATRRNLPDYWQDDCKFYQ